MRKKLIQNGRAVSYPVQSIMAFSVVAVMVAFYFIGIHGTFISHENSDIDISAKATDIAERLLNDPGQLKDLDIDWENDPSNISALGLNARPVPKIDTTKKPGQDFFGQVYGASYNGSTSIPPEQDIGYVFEKMPLIPSCFLSGTKIEMADGSIKNIEDIKVGDKVKSFDTVSKTWRVGTVTKVFHHSPEEMGDYYLVINHELRVTPNHLMYTGSNWIPAGKLKIGDIVNGIVIYSIEKVYTKVPTYNFEVEPYHNYKILFGKGNGNIVHNEYEYESGTAVAKMMPPGGVPPEFQDDPDAYNAYIGAYNRLKRQHPDWSENELERAATNWVRSWLGHRYGSFGEVKTRDEMWTVTFYEINGNVTFEMKGDRDFPYAILDERKITNLTKLDYEVAKEALGIDDAYDFNITITNSTGAKIVSYGEHPDSAHIVSICTRNILIRYSRVDADNNPVYLYEPAQMTVRIF